MLKKLSLIVLLASMIPSVAATDLPTDFDVNSKYRLDYSDLDFVLKGSVFEMGPSTHQRAIKGSASTGSKISMGNSLASRFEGNRVMLDQFKAEQIEMLSFIRDDLLAIPTQVPLAKLTKDAQLAYWFNLHNAIVLTEIASQYPVTDIEPFFQQNNAEAFYLQRKFDLNGTMISVKDIEDHVLKNWDDHVVIYGFYMGAVGTPNIRTSAYAAATVNDQLADNAVDFVNSVRGTQLWKKSTLRVATYYERMAAKFPEFQTDVLNHIQKYATKRFASRLKKVEKVKPEIEDWHIADLYNGQFNQTGGYASNTQDNLGIQIITALPNHVVELIRYRDEKNAKLSRKN
jgi:hypothetical protein